ncbi:PREDICTED: MFS-type transporter SLC18B1 [Chrysochloris asiatica]|uniref:MFS-type transporter SLC18B1 n=1 Tax=Chrysochloris asiatica TaxID=185453 RepID=A0A9B0WGC0_CHRAS|nr:PREDICTED: MFS-type transporter SLC18B1 [Chrysochloris asiatica]
MALARNRHHPRHTHPGPPPPHSSAATGKESVHARRTIFKEPQDPCAHVHILQRKGWPFQCQAPAVSVSGLRGFRSRDNCDSSVSAGSGIGARNRHRADSPMTSPTSGMGPMQIPKGCLRCTRRIELPAFACRWPGAGGLSGDRRKRRCRGPVEQPQPVCQCVRSSSPPRSSPRALGPKRRPELRTHMDAPKDPEGPHSPGDADPLETAREAPRRLSREQLFTLISAASINLGSSMCYSILGPFFPKEAEKKGASNTVIGMIFGCYALFDLLASLVFGKYLVHIGAKFMFIAGMFVSGGVTILFGVLDQVPAGPPFIAMCFLVRVADAVSFAAAITASFSILAKAFPNNVATVLGSLEIFSGLGLVLGPPLGGFLYQTFGYEMPFIFLGCIVLLMVPLNMYILPNYDADPSEHSFWKLITLPKVALIAFVINSLSAGFGFLDPTLSLFVLEKFNLPAGYVGLVFLGLALCYAISSPLLGLLSDKMPYLRKWLLVFGNLITAGCYMLLGPVPLLHIKSQLWMLVLVLVVIGISTGMSIIPTFPELLSCAYENGFEEGLSTLGLVSGLFGAIWSVGAFLGPTLGGFLYEKIGFEWAAAIQGLLPLTSGLAMGLYYLLEHSRRRPIPQDILGTEEERTTLLPNEI